MRDSVKYFMYAGLILVFLFYTASVYRLSTKDSSPNDERIMEGKMIWQQNNCSACHQIYGLGGFLGPDLTNVYSAKGKGSPYIKAFVKGGTAVMPAFYLQEHEMEALLAFFQHIDASGTSDPKLFETNFYGTIEQK